MCGLSAGAAGSERHSNRPIRDGMAPPPAAGGDAIVSTHTIPEEEPGTKILLNTVHDGFKWLSSINILITRIDSHAILHYCVFSTMLTLTLALAHRK